VHGIWVNSELEWKLTKFNHTLSNNGLDYTFADYQKHSSETFDPYAIPKIGNYGIDSNRNAAYDLHKNYYNKSIPPAQVYIIAS
jgi:hypothetical protein